MITPSKYIPFEKAIISKMLNLIKSKEQGILVTELYRIHESEFDGIDEFIFSLDVLYALDKIEINFSEGTVLYVD